VLMVLDHIAEQGDVDESERNHQARESCGDHPFGALCWPRLTRATKHAEGRTTDEHAAADTRIPSCCGRPSALSHHDSFPLDCGQPSLGRTPLPSSVQLPVLGPGHPDAAFGYFVSAVGVFDLPGRLQRLANKYGEIRADARPEHGGRW
jgi:hypothetical protein